LSVGGVNIRVENLQDCVLMKRMATAAGGRKWRKERLSFKKMKVGSMDVHLIGIDKRLPSIVKHSFLGYEHFRTATLAVTLDAVLPVQVLGVLSKAFLSYEKLEKQEQICHKQEVVWFWKYAMSLLEQTNQTSTCSHLLPAGSRSSPPENETLLHLLQLLPWPSAAKSSVVETCLRATFDDSMLQNSLSASRPPAGFLGLKPQNRYKEAGWSLCHSLGLSQALLYIHHVVVESTPATDTVILVTNRSVVCALQCRISGKAWSEWTLDSASMHNLPVIDGPNLVIHLVGDKSPVMVTCLSSEKLTSLQLAIEYSLLLSLPYNPVANVHFNSLVNQE